MSKFDHGKHVLSHDEDGNEIRSKKRLDGQKPSKVLAGRVAGFDATKASLRSDKTANGFNKPGSQNRNK